MNKVMIVEDHVGRRIGQQPSNRRQALAEAFDLLRQRAGRPVPDIKRDPVHRHVLGERDQMIAGVVTRESRRLLHEVLPLILARGAHAARQLLGLRLLEGRGQRPHDVEHLRVNIVGVDLVAAQTQHRRSCA